MIQIHGQSSQIGQSDRFEYSLNSAQGNSTRSQSTWKVFSAGLPNLSLKSRMNNNYELSNKERWVRKVCMKKDFLADQRNSRE
jgi:hypothetical protein